MQLSDYVSQFCTAIESNPADDRGQPQNINMTLGHQHMTYRAVISEALKAAFCGAGAAASDALFNRVQQTGAAHEQYKQAHQASLVELEKIKASKPIKAKREIQKTVKRGRIPKAKIEKAVKNVLKNKVRKASVDGGMLAELHG